MRTLVGLDIGGTKTAVVEGTFEGRILQRIEFPTHAATPFPLSFSWLAATVDEVLQNAQGEEREVQAISVSIGGPLRIEEGYLIDPPHLPGWHGVDLKGHLNGRFPGYSVFVEHDGNAGALAEYHFGVGTRYEGLSHLVFLTFGTGLGAGIIVNGQVVRGASDTAGEVGHLRLERKGPVGFGKAGSWEGFASGAGLVELAYRRNPERWPRSTSIRTVVEAMLADDEEALKVAAEAGTWMGRGMALIIDTLNPQVIVLGSLAVVLGERVLGPAREEVAREALPQAVAACDIAPAALGKRIGDVASLMAGIVRLTG